MLKKLAIILLVASVVITTPVQANALTRVLHSDGTYSGKVWYTDRDGNRLNGWIWTDGNLGGMPIPIGWYYYKNGESLTGQWFEDSSKKYFLDNNGCMLNNTVINGVYVDNTGAATDSIPEDIEDRANLIATINKVNELIQTGDWYIAQGYYTKPTCYLYSTETDTIGTPILTTCEVKNGVASITLKQASSYSEATNDNSNNKITLTLEEYKKYKNTRGKIGTYYYTQGRYTTVVEYVHP